MVNCIAFIVLYYIAAVVKGGSVCRQPTDSIIPANVNDAKIYGIDGMECISNHCVRIVTDLLTVNNGNISNVYDEAVQTGDATNLLKAVNAIEIDTTIKIMEKSLKCQDQKEALIKDVPSRIAHSNLDQAERLRQTVVTTNNNIYVIVSESATGRITSQAATAYEVTRLIQCTNCGSVTNVIRRVRATSIFLRHSLRAETLVQLREYNQPFIDELEK